MLLKTKENRNDNLTNATMLMKTNGLFFIPHDMYESKGSYLNPQIEKGDRGVRKIALALLRRATQKLENPGRAGRPRYLLWHAHPGHDLTRAAEDVKNP